MNRIKLALIALAVAAGILTATAACGSDDSVDYPAPASYSVSYMGSCYVGFLYDGNEAAMFPGVAPTCVRHVFPANPPLMGSLEWALWTHLLTYDSYYRSGFYYDQILSPMSSRYHVTIINKTTYLNTSHDFDSRNSSAVKSASAKAKWSNGKTGNYSFPATNAQAKNKPLTNNRATTGGGNAGTDNSNAGRTGTTGKTGTSTSGNRNSGGAVGAGGSRGGRR